MFPDLAIPQKPSDAGLAGEKAPDLKGGGRKGGLAALVGGGKIAASPGLAPPGLAPPGLAPLASPLASPSCGNGSPGSGRPCPRRRRTVDPPGHRGDRQALPTGGIRLGALHEAASAGPDTEHAAAATLFIAGILARLDGPILWVLRQADLFAPGLAARRPGSRPHRLRRGRQARAAHHGGRFPPFRPRRGGGRTHRAAEPGRLPPAATGGGAVRHPGHPAAPQPKLRRPGR